jgi:hypothetical protein
MFWRGTVANKIGFPSNSVGKFQPRSVDRDVDKRLTLIG